MKLKNKAIIGMVHVRALPGTPLNRDTMKEITETAVKEAKLLQEYGFDALILENMHDVPYLKKHLDVEITAAMTAVSMAVRHNVKIPLGIQILAGANKNALAVAKASGLDFIRAEGYVFAHIADEGIMESDAGELQRYRKFLNAQDIEIFCDIKKKHSSHAVTADKGIAETAEAAEFFLADGVIVTGSSTGKAVDIKELAAVKQSVNIKVLVGSGITPINLSECWKHADAFIVGSYIKKEGKWNNELDEKRCLEIINAAKKLKELS